MKVVVPYANENGGKKIQVEKMFNNIAFRYDLLNSILSLGIDKIWRKKAIKLLKTTDPKIILDVATGTGDFAIACCNQLNANKIIGVDISKEMLQIANQKKLKNQKYNYITFEQGDAENLQFEDNTFDACTVAFGVRNFEQLPIGLENIYAKLKPNGQLIILELTSPPNTIINKLYTFYFRNILPLIGKIISKDYAAYHYLFNSVQAFPSRSNFINEMSKVGFKNNSFTNLNLGICCIYQGFK
jgi:demethylmenaquinone methyltransferase/2-methoxy-6-polyprenyl-1,4-benzoquinol methylase